MIKISRHDFTLIELLIVCSVIAILAAILLPALTSARNRAKEAECANNLKLISLGMVLYTNDNNEMIPPLDVTFPYEGESTNKVKDGAGNMIGLAALVTADYNVRYRMFGCTLHHPRQPKRVIKDWENGGETRSAYIYRETDNGFKEILSHPGNTGKAVIMDFSMIKTDGSTDEIGHSYVKANIMFNDGHVENAYNSGEAGKRFTAAGDGLFIADETLESIDKIWTNADNL